MHSSNRTRQRRVADEVKRILTRIESKSSHRPRKRRVHKLITTTRQEDRLESTFDVEDNNSELSDVQDQSIRTEHGEQFLAELLNWSLKFNVPHTWLSSLLRNVRDNLLPNAPIDARTLLKTPRTNRVVQKCGGEYIYFGISSQALQQLSVRSLVVPTIGLRVGIDGIPVSKSSKLNAWPIIGMFDEVQEPFLIPLFSGYLKPTDSNEFLEDFVNECRILEHCGLETDQGIVNFRISKIIADAPARSMIKFIKQHNSYFSCERCVVKGTWDKKRVFTLKVMPIKEPMQIF